MKQLFLHLVFSLQQGCVLGSSGWELRRRGRAVNGGSGSVWRVSGAVTDGPPPHLLVYDNIAEAPCRDITELEHLPFLCVCRFLFKGRGCNGGATDGGHNLANYFFFYFYERKWNKSAVLHFSLFCPKCDKVYTRRSAMKSSIFFCFCFFLTHLKSFRSSYKCWSQTKINVIEKKSFQKITFHSKFNPNQKQSRTKPNTWLGPKPSLCDKVSN